MKYGQVLPVSFDHFVRMFLKQQGSHKSFYNSGYFLLLDPPESGEHKQCLPAGHLVNEGIILRAVAKVLSHL